MGILASVMANGLQRLTDVVLAVNGGRPPRREPWEPNDFLPQFDAPPRQPPAPENVHAFFTMLSNAGIGQLCMQEQ